MLMSWTDLVSLYYKCVMAIKSTHLFSRLRCSIQKWFGKDSVFGSGLFLAVLWVSTSEVEWSKQLRSSTTKDLLAGILRVIFQRWQGVEKPNAYRSHRRLSTPCKKQQAARICVPPIRINQNWIWPALTVNGSSKLQMLTMRLPKYTIFVYAK